MNGSSIKRRLIRPHRPLNSVKPAALWRSIQSEFRVDDAPGCAILLLVCHAADLADEAHDRGLLKEELAARAFVTRGLQKLNFDVEPTRAHAGRPPGPSIKR